MNKVIIVADSTCDLSDEIIKNNNIEVIPLHVTFSNASYDDRVDIDSDKLFELIDEKNEIPKSAGVTIGEFEEFFGKFINQGYDIYYCALSSTLSSTYSSACIAAESFPENRIFITDGTNLSTGTGLLIMKAVRYRNEGFSASEIKQKVDNHIPKVKTQFVIKTLNNLHKGGRCSSMIKFVGTLLRVKPMIVVRDGVLKVGRKNIGFMKNAVNSMLNIFHQDLSMIDKENLFVTYATGAEDSLEQINNDLKTSCIYDIFKNVYITKAGCVISAHCGEGSIGILYIMKGDSLNDKGLEEE